MVFGLLVLASLLDPVSFLARATQLNNLVLKLFSNGFSLAAFLFVATCIWAGFSPLGKVRIGGHVAKPLLSRWNWMAISLTTTIAIGIVFWGTAEPLYHLYAPGGTGIEPGSSEAQKFSMVSMYMHWSFTPYAIYTIPGLTFALVYYNLKKPFSLSSPLTVLTGRPIPKLASDLLDALALLALLLGLSASLGTGILSISGGITRLTNIPSSTILLSGIAVAIIAAFFISSATGLHKGIRILSDINTKIFLAIIVFIIVTGPILTIGKLGGESVIQYVRDFIPRSLTLAPFNDRAWLNSWTVFYFAVWMAIFGGLTLSIEASDPNVLHNVLIEDGPEHVLYKVLDYLPLSLFMAGLIVLVSFISYVTAADSNMDVIANLCSAENTETDMDTLDKPGRLIGLKLIWATAVGAAATIMTVLSGVDGIKMLSNLGGLVLGTIKLRELKAA